MYYYYTYHSLFGKLTIASNEENIVGLWMDGQKYYMDIFEGKVCREKETETIKLAEEWLGEYFANKKPEIDELPIEFIGSEFRKEIWEMLTEIPYGEVTTYGEIAKRFATRKGIKRMSAQAVGGAVSRNPISIIIPCHRVVGVNGSVTGYSGGIEAKIKLLEFEGVETSKLCLSEGKAR